METEAANWPSWLVGRMHQLQMSPSRLARESGVPDSVISRWRKHGIRPEVAQLRKVALPLRTGVVELLVASGHLGSEDIDTRALEQARPVYHDVEDALHGELRLDPESRVLLLLQYRAMLDLADRRSRRERHEDLQHRARSTVEESQRLLAETEAQVRVTALRDNELVAASR